MNIKENKTRISLWFHGKRFSKIELNKLTITNGFSNKHKNLWNIFYFKKIDDCLKILQLYTLEKNITTFFKTKKNIKNLYIKLF